MAWYNFKKTEKRSAIQEDNSTPVGGLSLLSLMGDGDPMALSAVFCAIELISNSIASLPIEIKRKTTDGFELIENHPITLAFRNCLMTKFMLIKQVVKDLLISGNGYIYINRANDGTVLGLQYLESTDVNVKYNKKRQELYYTSSFVQGGVIDRMDLIHIYKNSKDGIKGTGLLSFANNIINLSTLTDKQALAFFSSGCAINGILTVNGSLSEKQKQEIRENWRQTHGSNRNGIAVLPGSMTYQSIGSTAADSQLLESRLFNVQEIARYFCINPTLLGDLSKSSYNTLEQASQDFIIRTLMPIIKLLEDEFNRKLVLPTDNININFDEDYLVRGDRSSTATYLNTLVAGGIMTINEARTRLGLNKVEGGDDNRIAYSDANQNAINTQSDENQQDTNKSDNENGEEQSN